MPSGFDREAHLYDQRRGQPAPGQIAALTSAFEGCHQLLDLGGGTGRVAAPLEKAGFSVVVADLSRGMLVQARGKGLAHVVQANASCLPFRDGAFDGTFFVLLLHLVDDWAAAVHEIGRVTQGPVAALMILHEPNLRAIYTETRASMGHPTGRLDRGARELVELLPPLTNEPISESRQEVDAEAYFAGLEKMEGAPPGVHTAALARVRSLYGSTRVPRTETVRLAVWQGKDFAESASTA
ncbi:MAG: class I SAM-dependent methyltransferase [Thermoplasmata archaeon]